MQKRFLERENRFRERSSVFSNGAAFSLGEQPLLQRSTVFSSGEAFALEEKRFLEEQRFP